MKTANVRLKLIVFFLCLLSVARADLESASGKPADVRRSITESLRREFTFEWQPAPIEPATDTDVITLPSFAVVETKEWPELSIKAARRTFEAERFSWKSGGTLLKAGSATLNFKYNPERGFIELLKIAW